MRYPARELQFPQGGLDRALSHQTQPPYTSPDALNVWPYSPFDMRRTGGLRPGLSKHAPEDMGPDDVNMLAQVRWSDESSGRVTFTDTFDGTGVRSVWSSLTGVTNAPTTVEPFTVRNGALHIRADQSPTVGQTYGCLLSALPIDITGIYTIEMLIRAVRNTSTAGANDLRTFRLYFGMGTTGGGPGVTSSQFGYYAELKLRGGDTSYYELALKRIDTGATVVSTTGSTHTAGSGQHIGWLKVSVNSTVAADPTVTITWQDDTLCTNQAIGQVAADGYGIDGTRIGLSMMNETSRCTMEIDTFRVHYLSSSAPDRRIRETLVAACNAGLWVESQPGRMTNIGATIPLSFDRVIEAAPFIQKLYIADNTIKYRDTVGATDVYADAYAILDWKVTGSAGSEIVTIKTDSTHSFLVGESVRVVLHEVSQVEQHTVDFGTYDAATTYRLKIGSLVVADSNGLASDVLTADALVSEWNTKAGSVGYESAYGIVATQSGNSVILTGSGLGSKTFTTTNQVVGGTGTMTGPTGLRTATGHNPEIEGIFEIATIPNTNEFTYSRPNATVSAYVTPYGAPTIGRSYVDGILVFLPNVTYTDIDITNDVVLLSETAAQIAEPYSDTRGIMFPGAFRIQSAASYLSGTLVRLRRSAGYNLVDFYITPTWPPPVSYVSNSAVCEVHRSLKVYDPSANTLAVVEADVYEDEVSTHTVVNRTLTDNLVTITTDEEHGYVVGQQIAIDIDDIRFDGTFRISSVPSITTFTYERLFGSDVTGADMVRLSRLENILNAGNYFTKVTTRTNHNLSVGQVVNIKTSVSNPLYDGVHTVVGLAGGAPADPTGKVFYVESPSHSVQASQAENGTVSIASGTVTGIDDRRKGIVPHGSTMVCSWRGRLWWAASNTWFASRINDPLDYDYGADPADSARAIAGGSAEAGDIPDEITAIGAFGDNWMFIATSTSIYMLREDPAYGGRFDAISSEIGIVGPGAWCTSPDGLLMFLSQNGIYVYQQGMSRPERLTEKMPNELLNTPSDVNVRMAWENRYNGAWLFMTRADGNGPQSWWIDWAGRGCWPISLPGTMQPSSAFSYTCEEDPGESGVLVGGQDGVLRKFTRFEATDDGNIYSTQALCGLSYGPFQFGGPSAKGMIDAVRVVVSADQNNPDNAAMPSLIVYAADRAGLVYDPIITNQLSATDTLSIGDNFPTRVRLAGNWVGIKLRGGTTQTYKPWAIEGVSFEAGPFAIRRKP